MVGPWIFILDDDCAGGGISQSVHIIVENGSISGWGCSGTWELNENIFSASFPFDNCNFDMSYIAMVDGDNLNGTYGETPEDQSWGCITGTKLRAGDEEGYLTNMTWPGKPVDDPQESIFRSSYTGESGRDISNEATVSITVSAVNDAPVLSAIADMTTQEDVAVELTLTATDVDGDAVTFTAVSSDTDNISTDISGSLLTLTPSLNFNGSAVITVTANDGTEDSNIETFTLTVSPVNDAPVMVALSDVTTPEDETLGVPLSATDSDGDAVRYAKSPA